MDIKIVVAMHKPYWTPTADIYFPVHVGKKGKEGFGITGDDTRDHISGKNQCYAELTGLYWAWKNVDCDYLGLAHYRRYFGGGSRGDPKERIATRQMIETCLGKTDIILPKKRRYIIETLRSHFDHITAVREADLETMEATIFDLFSDYLDAYRTVMKRRWGHMFNMFIMKKKLADAYCEWLFVILHEVELRLDVWNNITDPFITLEDGKRISNQFNRNRILSQMSEFLLDVWIEKNKLPYSEMNAVFLEKDDQKARILKFLVRKLRLQKMLKIGEI